VTGDLRIRCACGAVRGVVRGASPSSGNHLVCHCDDCQAFAHFLARPDQILDAWGGTDIYQTSPAKVAFEAGDERLACMRLRPKGLLRWYASCCRTPIGNTVSAGLPFVGLIHRCLDDEAGVRGPVRARVFGRFARGDRSQLRAHDRAPLSLVLRFAWLIGQARLRGDQRRSPFFDPRTGEPVAQPRVLTAEELRDVESRRDAAAA